MSPAPSLLRAARHIWSAVIRRNRACANSGVIVHDPEAQKAKNLDDPFLDAGPQERAAKLIVQAAQTDKSTKKRMLE